MSLREQAKSIRSRLKRTRDKCDSCPVLDACRTRPTGWCGEPGCQSCTPVPCETPDEDCDPAIVDLHD